MSGMRAGPMGISLTGFLVVEVVEARRHALLLDGTARLGDGLALGLFGGRIIDNAGKGIIDRGIGGCRDGTGASGLAGGPAGNRCAGSDLGVLVGLPNMSLNGSVNMLFVSLSVSLMAEMSSWMGLVDSST